MHIKEPKFEQNENTLSILNHSYLDYWLCSKNILLIVHFFYFWLFTLLLVWYQGFFFRKETPFIKDISAKVKIVII